MATARKRHGGTGADPGPSTQRRDHRAQQRAETRTTTLVAGIVALVALPAWAVFDLVMVPDQARSFLGARIGAELAVALLLVALWWRPLGARWPEALSLLTVVALEVSIAWMVPRAGDQLEAYVLGLSLAVYATAFLVVWRWPMTVLLAAATLLALAVSSALADPGLDTRQVTTIAYYLATAFAMAVAAQVYRERRTWQQHLTRSALDGERIRNEVLVKELEQLSREDPLTALGNRRAWDAWLAREVLRSRRAGTPLTVLICDLDNFKDVNDMCGHEVGDAVLRAVSALLADRVRGSDLLARLGGDEFAVLCPETSLAQAADLGADIREAIRRTRLPGGVSMTCSIGAAEVVGGDAPEGLVRRADEALYRAKVVRDAFCGADAARAPAVAPDLDLEAQA